MAAKVNLVTVHVYEHLIESYGEKPVAIMYRTASQGKLYYQS